MNPLTDSGYLCIASEQPLPNIMGWAGLPNRPPIILILHTDNVAKSQEPARRMQKWWLTVKGVKSVQLKLVDTNPKSVLEAIKQFYSTLQNQTLVINSTGGSKPMHVGCVEALNTNNLLPNIRVIYRDLDQFYEYVKRADGLELSEFKVQTNVIKKISIKDWISLYIPQTWQMDDSKIPEFDLAAFFQDLRICNFQQALLRQSVALKNPDNVGECFELLVASLLKALNPEQILYNLKCSEEGRNHIESDLLVWHKQQLFLIELKASPKESWSQVMRVLEQTGRKLGGLNAKSMLIAPRLNIEAYKEAPSLADAYKIKLVTELELNNLPEQIAQWLGLPQAPENLRVLFKQNSNFLKRALSAPPMRKHY